MNEHVSKIKQRGLAYRVNGMTVEYRAVEKSKDTSIRSKSTTDLIKEASSKGYRKVEVIFKKIKISDFPKSTHGLASVKKAVGTQKKEVFDVVEEASDIISLLKNKDVEKIRFI